MQTNISPQDVLEAMNGPNACSDNLNNRTNSITINNQTNAVVVIALVQCINESLQVLPGFTSNTGVFVAAINQPPWTQSSIDPCSAGGHNTPIQATRIKCSAKLKEGDIEEDVPVDDAVAQAAGEYIVGTVFSFSPKRAAGEPSTASVSVTTRALTESSGPPD
jgi:hypothetical protein